MVIYRFGCRYLSWSSDSCFWGGDRPLGFVGDETACVRAKKNISADLADGSLPTLIDQVFEGIEFLLEAM